MKRIAGLFIMGVACAAAAAPADTILYQMPMDQIGWVPSQQGGSISTRAADDFTLPVGNGMPYAMGGIRARLYSLLGLEPSNYRMEIYSDVAGVPGDLLVTRSAYQVNPFGVDYFGRPIVQPAFFGDYQLPAGQRYWLSVFGMGEGADAASFASYNFGAAAPIGGPAMYRTGSTAWATASAAFGAPFRDLSFIVDVQHQLSVPTPGALTLAALGLAASLRRKR